MFTNDYSEKNRQLKKIVDKKIKKVMNIGDKYCKMKDSRIVECITYPQKKEVLWMKPIYACHEHIEEALDDAVYTGFEMPVLEQFTPVDNEQTKCTYCKSQPIYMVANFCSPTKS